MFGVSKAILHGSDNSSHTRRNPGEIFSTTGDLSADAQSNVAIRGQHGAPFGRRPDSCVNKSRLRPKLKLPNSTLPNSNPLRSISIRADPRRNAQSCGHARREFSSSAGYPENDLNEAKRLNGLNDLNVIAGFRLPRFLNAGCYAVSISSDL